MTHKTRLILAALLLAVGASRASAQNVGPFFIDGNVTDANNSGVAGATITVDANAGTKELGPKNASNTKIGVIHGAPPPMLDLTNPNAQVDLNKVYTQAKVAGTDLWFYFGWVRDSVNGSGFISIELQKGAPPAVCNYGVSTDAQLIAGCNPWVGRQDGDFIILWDQQGNSTLISYRIYSALLGQFGPATVIPSNIGLAVYGTGDTSRGEVAVNISAIVAGQSNECLSFANIIPGTVTGNSDTADYKDTVLSKFPVASNCGTVTVTKVTLNGAGTAFTGAASAGPFPFTLTASTTPIFDGTVDADCTTSGADKNTCQASLTQGGSSLSIDGLLSRTNYTLSEGTIPSKWEKVSIVCGGVNVTAGGSFTVNASQTTACTITNQLKQGKLRVIKQVINNNGGTAVAGDFTLDIGVVGVASFPGVVAPGTEFPLNDGVTYNVTELVLATGYEQTTSIGDCSGTIASGVTKECTIVNDDKAPSLQLIKVVHNTAGGTAQPSAFTLSAAGPTPLSGAGGAQSGATFQAGAYTLDETSVTGYSLETDWVCTGSGAQNAHLITLGIGQSAVCTIVNMDGKASPTAATNQRALLFDKITLTGIRPGASTPGTVTFTVFSDNVCQSQVAQQSGVAINGSGVAETTVTVQTSGTGTHTFYWTAAYTGDAFNNPASKACGTEISTVTFVE